MSCTYCASGVVKGFKGVKANTYDVIKTSIKSAGEGGSDEDSSIVSVCTTIKYPAYYFCSVMINVKIGFFV